MHFFKRFHGILKTLFIPGFGHSFGISMVIISALNVDGS